MNKLAKILLLAVLPLWITQTGFAQSTEGAKEPVIALQLNKAETINAGCRVSLLVRNHLNDEISQLSLDLVVFDSTGGISDFLSMKTGRLPTGKTRVQQYDLPSSECNQISSLLINDVSQCEGSAAVSPSSCLDALHVSSRAAIELTM
ncbi:hypothetical protein [Pseudovibrio sp. Tun.PSC04-5.I4]|uniref:hypothetical protein n=1 Tax=Pseudovibrio sp. Tun.PSC04-5.I4 TaxID=1798213 RepID=UPI00088A89ED|nr:hypothetical protein [Pseudovibrio sp. Tun.PSC04-5.I4]SDR17010.1 hypothetical protein SAMN04515695_3161 [Pseudovibrio sp. Tun.PSC04-5.I4]